MVRVPLALVLATALLGVLPASAQVERRVPALFYGANWDGEIEKNAPDTLRFAENERMATSGVESVRTPFEWYRAQRKRGAPFDLRRTDKLVLHAASHGLDVLPVPIIAPPWARQYKNVTYSPPVKSSYYVAYLRALVQRYGPNGTFWLQNPQLVPQPIHAWQIWNEPHLSFQWSIPKGFDYAPGYGQLLRASYKAIKQEDPTATVVLAGLSNESWKYLDHLYRKGHIKGSFDVAALHPYTSKPDGVITLIKRFRIVLRNFKDPTKPIWLTELGLPASKGEKNANGNLQTTDEGMAQFLWRAYSKIVDNVRSSLGGVERAYWYTWASVYCCQQFRYTGLLQYDNKSKTTPKPALTYYQRSARRDEGCQKDQSAQCKP